MNRWDVLLLAAVALVVTAATLADAGVWPVREYRGTSGCVLRLPWRATKATLSVMGKPITDPEITEYRHGVPVLIFTESFQGRRLLVEPERGVDAFRVVDWETEKVVDRLVPKR